jgi:hypothetical protein
MWHRITCPQALQFMFKISLGALRKVEDVQSFLTYYYPSNTTENSSHITGEWKMMNCNCLLEETTQPYKMLTSALHKGSWASQYSVWLHTGWPGFDPWQRRRIFPATSVSRPAMRSTQPPILWVLGVLYPGVKRSWGVKLTTHPHLVPRSKMSRSYTFSPTCHLHGSSRTALLFTYPL